MDMIIKIIEIRDEKAIGKLLSPPVSSNELSISPASTCSLIIHELTSIGFVLTTPPNRICQGY